MGRSGTSAYAVYALFSHFWYVGGFGDLGDPVVPTLRGASGDVVTVYASQDTEGRFLQSLALLRAVHNACQRREMAVSANNGLVNGQASIVGSLHVGWLLWCCWVGLVVMMSGDCHDVDWGFLVIVAEIQRQQTSN